MRKTAKKEVTTKEEFLEKLKQYVDEFEKTGIDNSSMGLEMLCSGVTTNEKEKNSLCIRYFKAKKK